MSSVLDASGRTLSLKCFLYFDKERISSLTKSTNTEERFFPFPLEEESLPPFLFEEEFKTLLLTRLLSLSSIFRNKNQNFQNKFSDMKAVMDSGTVESSLRGIRSEFSVEHANNCSSFFWFQPKKFIIILSNKPGASRRK